MLSGLLWKILEECNRLNAKSVAMPLLGTGKHNFQETVVLRLMRENFEIFSSKFTKSLLKEIILVRYDPGGTRKKNLNGTLKHINFIKTSIVKPLINFLIV